MPGSLSRGHRQRGSWAPDAVGKGPSSATDQLCDLSQVALLPEPRGMDVNGSSRRDTPLTVATRSEPPELQGGLKEATLGRAARLWVRLCCGRSARAHAAPWHSGPDPELMNT